MINKERYAFVFLAILAMLDQLFAYLFSVDFTYSSLSFVSHLCFCGCLLVVSHEKSLNRILYACLCGLCVGMFFTTDWFVKMILFGLFGWLIGFFKEMIDQNHWMHFAIVFLMMFVSDLLCFFLAQASRTFDNELCEMVYTCRSINIDFQWCGNFYFNLYHHCIH